MKRRRKWQWPVCLSVCLSTFMLMTRQWGRTIRLPLILALLLLLLRRVVLTSDRWRVQQRCEAVLHQLLACPPHHWHTSISAAAAVTLPPAAYSWAVLTVFCFSACVIIIVWQRRRRRRDACVVGSREASVTRLHRIISLIVFTVETRSGQQKTRPV